MIMNQQEAVMIAELIKKFEADRDRAQAYVDMMRGDLKDYMVKNGVEQFWADTYSVTCKERTRSTLDQKALKAEMPEVAERFTKIVTDRPLTIR